MTYMQAKMRVHNPNAYPLVEIKKAASYILGTLDATDEDIRLATYALMRG